MRGGVGLVLLLLTVGAMVVDAGASRYLLQSTANCPIDQCNKDACSYNSRRYAWSCSSCQSPLVPNQAKSACVCPAGQYPVVGSKRCALCPKGFYCPRGNVAGRSTAKACPKNMDTMSRGAKDVIECVNKPGFYYIKTATGVRAEPCPVDTYSPGLAKQTRCTRCLSGFSTDPELVPGSQTSSRVCLAKPGYFISGDSTAPCPQGEFNDQYDMATSCTPCSTLFDEDYAVGITTADSGTSTASGCRVAEPGFVLVTEKKMAILSAPAPDSGYKLGGAKPCPQKYFCPGGDVEEDTSAAMSEANTSLVPEQVGMLAPNGRVQLWTTGIPIRCPGGTWTEEEGAKTVDECVARPGSYISAGNATTPITAAKCPSGTYKEEWSRAAGCKSCEDPTITTTSPPASPWLSDENIYVNDVDPTTGLVNRQLPTRGSPESCFIQKGMGTLTVRSEGGKVTLVAQICPANSYGIDAARKYGRIATPCAPCPANMVTAGKNGSADVQITSYLGSDGLQHDVAADEGYFNIGACLTQAGSGYYNGNGMKCPKGTYSAGGDKMPCVTCPAGLTTNATASNMALSDCNMYMAGYGTVHGVVQQCPLGTYQPQDTAVGNDTACLTCSNNRWTPTVGAVSLDYSSDGTSCSLCAAGYGDDSWDSAKSSTEGSGPTCVECKDGLYGDLTRTNPKCQVCPIDRVFTYAYTGTPDVVKPQASSPLKANSISQCVTDFQQTVDGAFYIKFDPASMVTSVRRVENIQSCVEECRNTLGCAGITFNYDPNNKGPAEPCQLFKPAGADGSNTAAYGFAWKTMPSTVYAQSARSKAVGSGLFSFYWGVADIVFDAASRSTATGVTKLTECLNSCNNKNLCAGVTYVGYDPLTDAVTSCSYIMGTVEPGNAYRSLTKTMYERLQATATSTPSPEPVPSAPGLPTPTPTPGPDTPAPSPASPSPAAVIVPPGHGYYDGEVKACPQGTYSAGGTSAPCTLCPDGSTTNPDAINTNLNDCSLPLPGYYSLSGSVQKCPGGRTFAAASTNSYLPQLTVNTTSAANATSPSQCVTEFQTLRGGNSESELREADLAVHPVIQDSAGWGATTDEVTQNCLQYCRERTDCVAVRMSLSAMTCRFLFNDRPYRVPDASSTAVSAWKALPSSGPMLEEGSPLFNDPPNYTPSGLYSMFDGNLMLDPEIYQTYLEDGYMLPGQDSYKDCLARCDEVSYCIGVVMREGQWPSFRYCYTVRVKGASAAQAIGTRFMTKTVSTNLMSYK